MDGFFSCGRNAGGFFLGGERKEGCKMWKNVGFHVCIDLHLERCIEMYL